MNYWSRKNNKTTTTKTLHKTGCMTHMSSPFNLYISKTFSFFFKISGNYSFQSHSMHLLDML